MKLWHQSDIRPSKESTIPVHQRRLPPCLTKVQSQVFRAVVSRAEQRHPELPFLGAAGCGVVIALSPEQMPEVLASRLILNSWGPDLSWFNGFQISTSGGEAWECAPRRSPQSCRRRGAGFGFLEEAESHDDELVYLILFHFMALHPLSVCRTSQSCLPQRMGLVSLSISTPLPILRGPWSLHSSLRNLPIWFLLTSFVLLFYLFTFYVSHTRETMQSLTFWFWFISLDIMTLSFIHFPASDMILFLKAE